jgi:RNA polymerase sigma-70 factor (ECF subfamily)
MFSTCYRGFKMTDADLIAVTRAGDLRALGALMRTHHRMLYRTARAILRDDAEAEDAVQETFLQAYRALATFRAESKLSTWLVRIVANEALMRRRRNARAAAPGEAEPDDLLSDEAGPESAAHCGEMREMLKARLDALPGAYRSVFILRAIEDLSFREIGAALGMPEATARTRFSRARSLLQNSMVREVDKPSSLESSILITEEDRARLMKLNPNAALLREIDRASVMSPEAAALANAVTMNTQVLYTDEATGRQEHLNLVYPQEAGGCACCVSILAPVGTALLGLSAGQAIEWDFPDGAHRRLRVDQVIRHDCPINERTAG